ncbi:MAG: 16S rRNA (uracil(1498)-N(3))-methyltransferase [Arachnia sp.]
MSDALFLAPIGSAQVGTTVSVTGEEAHHAVVKRLQPGETVLLADGQGNAVRGEVLTSTKQRLEVTVTQLVPQVRPQFTFTAVQALAKGERSELAVEMLTEVGVHRILAWQAARSIVRWHGERGQKALAKWRRAAREATKQSRRALVPTVESATTSQVAQAIAAADLALVLHEAAGHYIAEVGLPTAGSVVLIVGPEGGIAPDELAAFEAAGAQAISLGQAVLRTSTAGPVAVGQLQALAARATA